MSANSQLTENELNRIREACFDLSSQVKWTKTTDSENIIDQVNEISIMAEEVLDCTIKFLLGNMPIGCTVDSIIRIVNYITVVHAVPISHCDINWYRDVLSVLMELSYPTSDVSDNDYDFIEIDLRKRVEKDF